jgi:hypothetical protein
MLHKRQFVTREHAWSDTTYLHARYLMVSLLDAVVGLRGQSILSATSAVAWLLVGSPMPDKSKVITQTERDTLVLQVGDRTRGWQPLPVKFKCLETWNKRPRPDVGLSGHEEEKEEEEEKKKKKKKKLLDEGVADTAGVTYVITAVPMKITVLFVVMSCSLAEPYHRFEGTQKIVYQIIQRYIWESSRLLRFLWDFKTLTLTTWPFSDAWKALDCSLTVKRILSERRKPNAYRIHVSQ